MKFRKKPIVIEAFQWDGNPMEPYQIGIHQEEGKPYWHVLLIPTLEGTMEANPGDYIITGIKGEVYPCKPDIFEATYDRVGGGE